jgi:hypothetical protein
MKKILLLILCATSVFAQSVTIVPDQVSKLKTTALTSDDVVITEIGGGPTLNGQRANGTVTTKTTVQTNNRLFTIGASGNIGAGYANFLSSGISFEAAENWTTAAQGNSINFFTADYGTTTSPKVITIDDKGYLGLNTSSPTNFLHIKANPINSRVQIGLVTSNLTDVMEIRQLSEGYSFDMKSKGNFDLYSPAELNVYSYFTRFIGTSNNTIAQWTSLLNSGDLAIGAINSNNAKLYVRNNVTGGSVTNDNTTKAVFESDAANYVGLYTPNGFETGIGFGRPALGAFSGGIIYNSINDLNFRTNTNDTRMSITDAGKVGIGINPIAKFHVAHGLAGFLANNINTNSTMVVESSGSNILMMASASGTAMKLNFARPSSTAGISNTVGGDFNFTMGSTVVQTIDNNGNTGIGDFSTLAPAAKLHIDGDFALRKKVLLTGNGVHNNEPRQGASVISVATGGGTETLSGLSNGVDGLLVYIYPIQGTSIILQHENTGSNSANRIITQTGTNVNISNTGGATLIYDESASRWRVLTVAN